ncbi:MAG: hypothetical protein Kow00124_16410 [Anaerolineae bacterium]
MILIVDDHDTVRESLTAWIRTALPDCTVMATATGQEAVELSRQAVFDVVLMDLGLPDISGIEATRHIKQISPQTRVVMLTIYEDRAYQEDAAAAGASAFIPKRLAPSTLLPEIEALLGRSPGADQVL